MNLDSAYKRTPAAVLILFALTLPPPAGAGGIPVYDGAKFAQDQANWAKDAADRAVQLANWVTQLENWKRNLANLVRGGLMEIPAVKQALEKHAQNQIDNLFKQRRQNCLRLSNPTSQFFCTRTVDLEQEKYRTLTKLDADIARTFAQIRSLQRQHASLAGSQEDGGRQQRIEQEIQIAVGSLDVRIRQHMAEISAKNQLIAEYRNARIMLGRNQFAGNGGTTDGITRAAVAGVLQAKASGYREQARERQRISTSISNRF